MDTQLALRPNGQIHSVSTVWNAADAERFERVMVAQGFTVERLSAVAAAARLARPSRQSSASAQPVPPLPDIGTEIRFPVDGQLRTGAVAAVLRWPVEHQHSPGRVALLVRLPGLEMLVNPQARERRIEEPTAKTPQPVRAPTSLQARLW